MRAALMDSVLRRYGGSIGASATIYREPGQARKGAAEAVDLCAGVLLVESPPEFQIGVRPQDISSRQMHWGLTPIQPIPMLDFKPLKSGKFLQ